MKTLWILVTWFALALSVGAAFGGARPAVELPSIHLVRVNDPWGMEGFDLKCEEREEAEPECHLTPVKKSKALEKVSVTLERAQELARGFLAGTPRERLFDVASEKPLNPPVGDVLLLWNVRLGRKATNGFVRRSPKDPGVDSRLLKQVLMLESSLTGEDGT